MPLEQLIKKHLVWMLISYIVIAVLVHTFFLGPQKGAMQQYQKEKDEIEYAYTKINSPVFLESLNKTIISATIKTDDFLWLDKDIDRGLALYNYLYLLADKSNVELLSVSAEEKTSASTKKTEAEKLYYRWKVKLTGSFPDVVSFIEKIENSRKFLIVYEIFIQNSEHGVIYELTLLGLKNNADGSGENGKDK